MKNIRKFLKCWFIKHTHLLGLMNAEEARMLSWDKYEMDKDENLIEEAIKIISSSITEACLQGYQKTKVYLDSYKFYNVEYMITEYLIKEGYVVLTENKVRMGEDVIEFEISW